MNPIFSVIVPIYNVERYLRQCIESMIKQDFPSVEIILVDDGSTDSSPMICDEYAKVDKRLKIIHKKNGGLVSARQAGACVAMGKYILNVDGDDWVDPEYFRELDNIVSAYEPDMICFGAVFIRENKVINHIGCNRTGLYDKSQIEKYIYPVLIEDEIGSYFSPSIWSKAIKKEIYLKCQMHLDQRIKIGEDHAVTKPAIYQSNSIFLTDKCLYCYRLNPSSMTKEKKAFSWIGPELIGKNFEEHIDMNAYDFQEQVYRNVVHNLFNVVVSQFYRKESMIEIRRDIKRNLCNLYYKNAISKCHYKDLKNRLALAALKHEMIVLFYLFSIIR